MYISNKINRLKHYKGEFSFRVKKTVNNYSSQEIKAEKILNVCYWKTLLL